MGLGEADVADVTQEVWTRLVEHIDDIRNPDGVGMWLATTAHNECMRLFRQRSREIPFRDIEVLDRIPDEHAGDAERRVDNQDRDAQVREILSTLPARHQAVLELVMSKTAPGYLDVASTLGIPVGSIGPTRQRCLRVLRARCVGAGVGL